MLNKQRSWLGRPGLALHCLLFIIRLILLCHMVKNWSLASKIAAGRQEKLARICLQVSFTNECTDAAVKKMHGRNYEQERAGASPNFVTIMWFSGNEKSGHCSHALSPEDWLCCSICVKCWTGSFHSETRECSHSPAGGTFGKQNQVMHPVPACPRILGCPS